MLNGLSVKAVTASTLRVIKNLSEAPVVKGTFWTRIGLGLVHYGPVLGIEQFLIKRTLSRSFTRTHASTPARKHTPV